jgi:hypothetical protein
MPIAGGGAVFLCVVVSIKVFIIGVRFCWTGATCGELLTADMAQYYMHIPPYGGEPGQSL